MDESFETTATLPADGGAQDEEFRPAHEVFGQSELDYLEAQGGDAEQIALARQSLYVRFDPLVDSASSAAHVSALPKSFSAGNDLLGLDTPEKVQAHRSALAQHGEPSATPSSLVSAGSQPQRPPGSSDEPVAVSTPTARVPAASTDLLMNTPQAVPIGHDQSEPSHPAAAAPSSSDVDLSVFSRPATSPSPAKSPSPTTTTASPVSNSPPVTAGSRSSVAATQGDLIDVLKYSEADIQRRVDEAVASALERLRAESRQTAQKSMERIEELTNETRTLQEKCTNGDTQLHELRQVVDDYNSTMSKTTEQSAARKESLQKEVSDLSESNSQMTADINSLENSFADLHNRYERLRAANDIMRKSEATLQETESRLREQVETAAATNQKLKEHAAEQVHEANVKMQRIVHEHRSEVTVLTANLKTLQVKVDSLDRSLKQKEEENKELTTICEDMMKQMRPS